MTKASTATADTATTAAATTATTTTTTSTPTKTFSAGTGTGTDPVKAATANVNANANANGDAAKRKRVRADTIDGDTGPANNTTTKAAKGMTSSSSYVDLCLEDPVATLREMVARWARELQTWRDKHDTVGANSEASRAQQHNYIVRELVGDQ